MFQPSAAWISALYPRNFCGAPCHPFSLQRFLSLGFFSFPSSSASEGLASREMPSSLTAGWEKMPCSKNVNQVDGHSLLMTREQRPVEASDQLTHEGLLRNGLL